MTDPDPFLTLPPEIRERERTLAEALACGKILAASLDNYRERWTRAPKATARLLGELAPGLPPSGAATLDAEQAAAHADAATAFMFGPGVLKAARERE